MYENEVLNALIKKMEEDLTTAEKKVKQELKGIILRKQPDIVYTQTATNHLMNKIKEDDLSKQEIKELAMFSFHTSRILIKLKNLKTTGITRKEIDASLCFAVFYGVSKKEYISLLITLLSYMENKEYAQLFGHDGKIKKTTNLNPWLYFLHATKVPDEIIDEITVMILNMISSFADEKKNVYDILICKMAMITDYYCLLGVTKEISPNIIKESLLNDSNETWYSLYEKLTSQPKEETLKNGCALYELQRKYALFIKRYKDGYVFSGELPNFCKFLDLLEDEEQITERMKRNILITALEKLVENESDRIWGSFSLFLSNHEIVLPKVSGSKNALIALMTHLDIPKSTQEFLMYSAKTRVNDKEPTIQELFSLIKIRLHLDIDRFQRMIQEYPIEGQILKTTEPFSFPQIYEQLQKNEIKDDVDFAKCVMLVQKLCDFVSNIDTKGYQFANDDFYTLEYMSSFYGLEEKDITRMTIAMLRDTNYDAMFDNKSAQKIRMGARTLFSSEGYIKETENFVALDALEVTAMPFSIKLEIINQVGEMIDKSKLSSKENRNLGCLLLYEINDVVRGFIKLQKNGVASEEKDITIDKVSFVTTHLFYAALSLIKQDNSPVSYYCLSTVAERVAEAKGVEVTKTALSYLLKCVNTEELIASKNEVLQAFGKELTLFQKGKQIANIDAFTKGLEEVGILSFVDMTSFNIVHEEKDTKAKIKRKIAYYFDGEKFIRPITNMDEFEGMLYLVYSKEEATAILAELPKEEAIVHPLPAIYQMFGEEDQNIMIQAEKLIKGYQKEISAPRLQQLVLGLHADESKREELLATTTYEREGKLIYIADISYLLGELKLRAELLQECEDDELRAEANNILAMIRSCMEGLYPKEKDGMILKKDKEG